MSKKQGRRLKRYLGLKRKKSQDFLGGIENISTGSIQGWISFKSNAAYEVRLLVGPNLIASSIVNLDRPDVSSAYKIKTRCGFNLELPNEIPPIDWSHNCPQILAVSADGSALASIPLLKNPSKTPDVLQAVLSSGLTGLIGHFDGLLQDGMLHGWAGRRDQHSSHTVWLHTLDGASFSVICNKERGGMDVVQMPNNCGFIVNPYELPESFTGKTLYCSFDQEGLFRLPGSEYTFAPASTPNTSIQSVAINSSNIEMSPLYAMEQSSNTSHSYEEHWQELEAFKIFLDSYEHRLDSQMRLTNDENSKIVVKPASVNILSRFFKNL